MNNCLLPICAVLVCFVTISSCCNEGLCVSIVSKCMLIKSCDCDVTDKKNCTCCKDCQICLSKLYHECCSCIELCPKSDDDDSLEYASTIEDLAAPLPELFNVLTEEPDVEQRWTTYSHPIHYDALLFKPEHGILDLSLDERTVKDTKDKTTSDQNCTVAFMSQCMPLRKCKESCRSMGAARYRWFHINPGCCQCIGNSCISYGYNSPKCSQCPVQDEETEIQLEKDVDKLIENADADDGDDDEYDDDDDEGGDGIEDIGISQQ